MTGVVDREPTWTTGERLQEELHALLARRRLVVLEHAALLGSADDAVDMSSRVQRELDRLDERVAELRHLLDGADLDAPDARAPVAVGLGARVTVRWDDGAEETYRIVGPTASDPRRGWISTYSPVGWGLLDRRTGERVAVATPDGRSRLVVVAVA